MHKLNDLCISRTTNVQLEGHSFLSTTSTLNVFKIGFNTSGGRHQDENSSIGTPRLALLAEYRPHIRDGSRLRRSRGKTRFCLTTPLIECERTFYLLEH
jgi:hypothetical protein